MTEDEDGQEVVKDRFGLKKMSLNQEVAVSFTLFTVGIFLILSVLYLVSDVMATGPAFLGLVMVGTGYFFAIESIRELEEKDHFLASKLMGRKKQ